MVMYEALIGRIIVVFGSRKKFAEAMKMSQLTLQKKLTGAVDWKQSEIVKACELLRISLEEIGIYFFSVKV